MNDMIAGRYLEVQAIARRAFNFGRKLLREARGRFGPTQWKRWKRRVLVPSRNVLFAGKPISIEIGEVFFRLAQKGLDTALAAWARVAETACGPVGLCWRRSSTDLEDGVIRKRLGTAARTATIERHRMNRIVQRYAELYAALRGGQA